MRKVWLGTVLGVLAISLACVSGSGTNSQGSGGPKLTSIAISAQSTNVTVGQSVQLTATGTYSDQSTKDLTSSVTWSSSDASIATISTSGVLTAVASGPVSITAAANSVTGSLKLTIAASLVSIAVTTNLSTIAKNTTSQFIATGTYSDKSTQNITSSVTWTSSNTAVATIGSAFPTAGLAAGLTAGTTAITAASGSISSSPVTLTVTNANASGLTITPSNPTLPLDQTQQLTATATFSDGSSQDVTDVVAWSSDTTSVATVTASGLVTGRDLGSSNITADFTADSVQFTTKVTVDASDLSSIAVQPANATIAQGTKILYKAVGTFNDGSTHILSSQVTWSSPDTSVVSISGNTVTGKAIASSTQATINATLGSVSGSAALTVTNATITGIVVTPNPVKIPISGSQALAATGQFSDSSSQNITSTVTWSSDNTSVATVGNSGSATGVASGIAAGSANVSAAFSFAGASATGTVPVSVSSSTPTQLSVTPSSSTVAPGAIQQLDATATWSDGSSEIVNTQASWSSSNSQIATVNIGGTVTGQSQGLAKITATFGGASGTASVAVEGSGLESITITPQNAKVPEGIQLPFTAQGNFANGSIDLTTGVTWTSSDPSVATISNGPGGFGVATGGSTAGSTTITAAFAGQSQTTTLNVTNAKLTSISISPINPAISAGGTQQFTATGTFDDGESINLSSQVTWTSTNVTVATINSSGVATASNVNGTTTIQASLDGATGSTTLTVH